MIEWRQHGPTAAFYSTADQRQVGEFFVDKSRRKPTFWRLRFNIRYDGLCKIVRIAKPSNVSMPLEVAHGMSYESLRLIMDDIVGAAKTFGLITKGNVQVLANNAKIFKTDFTGVRPFDD